MKRNIDMVMVMVMVALVPACAAFDTETVAPETGTVSSYEGGDGGCVGVNCPGNSPLYAALGIFELSLNPAEVSVRGFSLDPSNIKLGGQKLTGFHVDGANVSAVLGGAPITGPGVVGMTIPVRHDSGTRYELKINSYMTTGYYTNPLPANLPPFFAYEITYRDIKDKSRDPWIDLCPYVDLYDNGVLGTWAVFWKGDRIDPVTGIFTTHDADVGDWFNISCAGEATIKMLRTGTGGAVDPSTPPAQRQATLDMFTARYCPNKSDRYTELGQYIDWDDKTGSNTTPSGATYEAIWDGNGAVCLNTPRIPGQTYVCEPRSCTDEMLTNWQNYGWLRSGYSQLVR